MPCFVYPDGVPSLDNSDKELFCPDEAVKLGQEGKEVVLGGSLRCHVPHGGGRFVVVLVHMHGGFKAFIFTYFV